MRLRPTKSTIAILAALLGLTIVVSGSLFFLQRGWLSEATDQLQEREAELYDGQRIAKRREAATTALQEARTQIANLESGVNDASYVPTFLRQIEALAVNTKNRVVGVRPSVVKAGPSKIEQRRDPDAQGKEGEGSDAKKEEKPEPYTRLEVEVNLIGRYATSQEFVQKLMLFPKIISVDQVQLRPHHGAEETPGLLEVQLKITAFIMKQQTLPGGRKAESLASADLGGIN